MNLLLLIAILSSTYYLLRKNSDKRRLEKRIAYVSWILYLLPMVLHLSVSLFVIFVLGALLYVIIKNKS